MKTDFEHVRAALRGEQPLDEDVLARVLRLAEDAAAARVEETVACAAVLNGLATGLRAQPRAAPAARDMAVAGLLQGMQALLVRAGTMVRPCRHCRAAEVHHAACPLSRALQAWRRQLVPGKAEPRN